MWKGDHGQHASLTTPIRCSSTAAWLRQLALRLVRDPESAEDLLQDTWVRAIEKPPRGAQRGSVRAWLGTVLRNAARRRWQRGELRQRLEAMHGEGEPQATTDDLFAFQRELMQAVDHLEALHREAILLRYFENLPPRKIAARLGLPVKMVNSRLLRALQQLRVRLDAEHGGQRRSWALCTWPLLPKRSTALALTTGTYLMGLKISIAVLVASMLCFFGWQNLRTNEGLSAPKMHEAQEPDQISTDELAQAPAAQMAVVFVPNKEPSKRTQHQTDEQGRISFAFTHSGKVMHSPRAMPMACLNSNCQLGQHQSG